MTRVVKIDFVADVVCPWCALGFAALEQAVSNLAGEVAVELSCKPFELNPDMPVEGEPAVSHMMRKYGRTAEQVAERNAMVIARGKSLGFYFDLEKRTHFYNTFDAHRLLLWSAGQGRQVALKKALLQAYFINGANVGERETLVRLAEAAGLSGQAAREVLASASHATEVRELESFYQRRGIDSVPAMVLNDRQLVSGSQSVADYEAVIRQMAQSSAA